MYFYWNVLPSAHACCLTLSAKQDGLRYLAFLFRAGRDRHSCVLAALFGYLPLWVHFGFGCFFMAISTGLPRMRERGERGTGLAALPLCAFAQSHWLCSVFRRENAGAARPRLRQRVFDSLDSLHAAAGLCWCVYARRHPGTRKDLTGSDLWPVRSCCIAMLPTRTIGDLPDSDLWSGRSCITARQQVDAGTAGLSRGLSATPPCRSCGCCGA